MAVSSESGFKLLLAGKNNLIIDDFFDHMEDEFDVMTTSLRYRDMVNHLDKFQPDLFVYCLYNESDSEYKRLIEFKRRLTRQDVNLAIIGSAEDCEEFQRGTNQMAELVLTKPLTVDVIRARIHEHLMEQIHMREENLRIQQMIQKNQENSRRRHVLIIDDDPMMLKLVKEYLHEKYDVATAISGKIAYKFLESKHTDLILLDYEMPVENGPQVFENLRKNPNLENVPILYLTGTTDRQKIQQALKQKPQGYLLKPIDREKLLGNIEKFFGER